MKALLLKDYYTLKKQLNIFLLIIVVFSVVPGNSMSCFVIVFVSMLPITAIAYDERCKWDNLAIMMPFSTKSIVISKYMLGYISIAVASVLQAIINAIKGIPFIPNSFYVILIGICIAIIIQSFNLPFMFKLGVEKGRLVFYGVIAIFAIGLMVFGDSLENSIDSENLNLSMITVDLIIATIVINIISILISEKLYSSKKV